MQLNIKNDEAHRLAKELAMMTGESMTEAVTKALRKRVREERERKKKERGSLAERLAPIIERVQESEVLDDRPGDEILYDERGLPKKRESST